MAQIHKELAMAFYRLLLTLLFLKIGSSFEQTQMRISYEQTLPIWATALKRIDKAITCVFSHLLVLLQVISMVDWLLHISND